MPIPSQNEILVPFLEVLRDGQPYTRSQILYALAKRFNLTEDELNDMSGRQFTIINRVAWCDAYFNKAGFIKKDRDPKNSMQDVFRITVTGQNQINRHANRIDVGYLQSFYQGNVYRGAGSSDTTSDAELDLFEKLDKLPKDFVVFHSVAWIGQDNRSVGEIDFLIAHPDYGLLILEVKGGRIEIQREGNNSIWYSRSRDGKLHTIGDPMSQAERNRRELHEHLKNNSRTKRFEWAIFPAIALPDSQVDDNIRMDYPPEVIVDHRHIDSLAERLISIFTYWQTHADRANKHFSGQQAIDALINDLVPSRKLSPRIGDMFERENRKIEQLTEEQFQLLRFLQMQKRAAIVGGAGTGKTMLAIEKANQLAEEGLRVLFLAFNRNIVDWIENTLDDNLITVSTYHSLVGTLQSKTGLNQNRGMDWNEFTAKSPDMLLSAAEWIRKHHPDDLWDAVIVDEAQDFE